MTTTNDEQGGGMARARALGVFFFFFLLLTTIFSHLRVDNMSTTVAPPQPENPTITRGGPMVLFLTFFKLY